MLVRDLKAFLDKVSGTNSVVFETRRNNQAADASFCIDRVENRSSFVVLISED